MPFGGPTAPCQDKCTIPSYTLDGELIPEELLEATWNLAGSENRVFYVLYNSMAASHRTASLSVTPALTFGNQGAKVPHKSKHQTYSEEIGQVILGGQSGQAKRIAAEGAKMFLNFMRASHLETSLDLATILRSISYNPVNGDGPISIDTQGLDIVQDQLEITIKRAAFAEYRQQCQRFYIRGTKTERANSMAWLKVSCMDYKSFPLTERHHHLASTSDIGFPNMPEYLISRVDGRKNTEQGVSNFTNFSYNVNNGDTVQIQWSVMVINEGEPRHVLENEASLKW